MIHDIDEKAMFSKVWKFYQKILLLQAEHKYLRLFLKFVLLKIISTPDTFISWYKNEWQHVSILLWGKAFLILILFQFLQYYFKNWIEFRKCLEINNLLIINWKSLENLLEKWFPPSSKWSPISEYYFHDFWIRKFSRFSQYIGGGIIAYAHWHFKWKRPYPKHFQSERMILS